MSVVGSTHLQAFHSPKQRLLDTISDQVSAGTIGRTDETALNSAVDTIDSALKSDSSSSAARLGPSEMKSRIDDLIAQQVGSGALTSDQAETLKQVFSRGSGGGAGGIGGAGEPPPAPPPGPPPSGDASTSDDASTDTDAASLLSASTSTGSTAGSASDLLASFIQQLKSAQSQAGGYGTTGASGSSRTASALLLNFKV